MGTRSLTRVFDNNNREICCIYQQWDGYLEGVGATLAAFIKSGQMVNGIPGGTGPYFNGPHCFAAQLVMHLKQNVKGTAGSVYLYAPGSKDVGEEFEYHLRPTGETSPMALFVIENRKPVAWETITRREGLAA